MIGERCEVEVGGERWSTNQAAPRETASSGKYKAQGRTVALHLLGTSGCMRLSETMDLEIVGQGSSTELKPECCHIGKHLCPGQVSRCRLLYMLLFPICLRRCLQRRALFCAQAPCRHAGTQSLPGKRDCQGVCCSWQRACPSQPPRFPSCF